MATPEFSSKAVERVMDVLREEIGNPYTFEARDAARHLIQAGWDAWAKSDNRPAYRKVIDEALDELAISDPAERKALDNMLRTDMQRQMNMSGGRPSDCARSAVYVLRRLGIENYRAEWYLARS